MVLQSWEPYSDIVSLRDAMDRLFEQSVVRPSRAAVAGGMTGPKAMPVDVYEKDTDYIVRAYVPGVKADEVEISAEQGMVSIKARIPSEVEQEDAKSWKWLAAELGYGDVVRTLTLPMPIAADKIEAQVENGVLTVMVPKAEEAKPRKITVKSK